MSVVLGLSAYHADAAAALLVDGQIAAAAEEERFTRVKHWAGFPRESILSCLGAAGVEAREVDHFAVGRNPRANLARRALFALRARPGVAPVADRARSLGRVHEIASPIAETLGLDRAHVQRRLGWVEHHPAHLASAYLASPFDSAAVAAVDGFGDFVSTSWAMGEGSRIDVLRRIYFPHSLGLVYLAITQYLGFASYGDEYKVMGLAAYGAPDFIPSLRRLVRLVPGGGFELDGAFFRHAGPGVRMTWDGGAPVIEPVYTPALEALLGPARRAEDAIEARHEAIAASVQALFEDALFHALRALHERTRLRRLCLAGGCAFNSVANGKIRARTPFEEVYVPPVAGDAGTALGAALLAAHRRPGPARRAAMAHAFWGPAFGDEGIRRMLAERRALLEASGSTIHPIPDEEDLCRFTAAEIARGKVVGWFQGRMEVGPRALGNRSILADPRRPDMRDVINGKVKFREPFRPFAPSILEERVDDYFVGAAPDPFMAQVAPVRPERRAAIPAVVHVDGSGRPQAVARAANPRYWRLIAEFDKLTGVPVLLNTSFNENEPIVLDPAQALDCFLRTGLDLLVLGTTVLDKSRRLGASEQPSR